jgi:hypothetical protein
VFAAGCADPERARHEGLERVLTDRGPVFESDVRVVVRDDAKLGKDFKSRLYHIYTDPTVKDDINQKVDPHVPLPDLVNTAYTILGNDWNETRKRWEQEGAPTPPVMITVANLTHTAARVGYALTHKKIPIEKLVDLEGILHIDSKVLGEAEAQELVAGIRRGFEHQWATPVDHPGAGARLRAAGVWR